MNPEDVSQTPPRLWCRWRGYPVFLGACAAALVACGVGDKRDKGAQTPNAAAKERAAASAPKVIAEQQVHPHGLVSDGKVLAWLTDHDLVVQPISPEGEIRRWNSLDAFGEKIRLGGPLVLADGHFYFEAGRDPAIWRIDVELSGKPELIIPERPQLALHKGNARLLVFSSRSDEGITTVHAVSRTALGTLPLEEKDVAVLATTSSLLGPRIRFDDDHLYFASDGPGDAHQSVVVRVPLEGGAQEALATLDAPVIDILVDAEVLWVLTWKTSWPIIVQGRGSPEPGTRDRLFQISKTNRSIVAVDLPVSMLGPRLTKCGDGIVVVEKIIPLSERGGVAPHLLSNDIVWLDGARNRHVLAPAERLVFAELASHGSHLWWVRTGGSTRVEGEIVGMTAHHCR